MPLIKREKQMMRKTTGRIFSLIIACIIIAASLYLISYVESLRNPMHMASVLGYIPLTVASESMSPGIETGDMVVIKRGSTNIEPGDIVTYRLGEVLVTHRVKAISGEDAKAVFLTQGDANAVPDYKAVERSQIIGKYAFKIPLGGYIKASLRGLPGMIIILGLSLIALMSELLRYTTMKVKEAEKSLME